MPRRVSHDLIYAHFFFVDVVGLSEPLLSTRKQIKKIEVLNNLISTCAAFKESDKNSRIILPAGDGVAIGFLQGPEYPLRLSIELHKQINKYNRDKSTEETLRIRIGLNDGPVYVVNDLENKKNVWGPGIIMARRVMDIGEDGHILLTQRMAETLRELSDEYRLLIKPLQDYTIKHGKKILLYSVHGSGIGNPTIPKNNKYQKSRLGGEIAKRRSNTIFHEIDVRLSIVNSQTMLTHHKRLYKIENISDDPLNEFLFGIATDVPKSFLDLHARISDENGRDLNIISINYDKPYHKEFTVLFKNPIIKGQKNRHFTFEYDVEEPKRYFENYFGVDCRKYITSLEYREKDSRKFNPVMYDINTESKVKSKSKTKPTLDKNNGTVRVSWSNSSIVESQAFRLEW